MADVLTTAEVAAKLKLDPKRLRALLRSMGKGAKGKNYQFSEKDIPKLGEAIKQHALKPVKK